MKIISFQLKLLTFLFVVAINFSYSATTKDESLRQYVSFLKSQNPINDDSTLSAQRKTMVEFWSLFLKNKNQYLPLIKAQVLEETQKTHPHSFVLLDLLSFLIMGGVESPSNSKMLEAYFKINAQDKIILNHWDEYFLLSIWMAASEDSRMLNHFDKIFLSKVFNASELNLTKSSFDPSIQILHLYGAYGNKSVAHFLRKLETAKNEEEKEEYLLKLRRLCTQECTNPIYNFVKNGASQKILKHATYILLDLCGEKGRELFLSLDPQKYTGESIAFLEKEKKYALKLNFDFYKKRFARSESAQMSDEIVRAELKKSYFLIHDISNSDVLNSQIPREELLSLLYKMRSGLFRVVNQHAFEALQDINSLINAIYFRAK